MGGTRLKWLISDTKSYTKLSHASVPYIHLFLSAASLYSGETKQHYIQNFNRGVSINMKIRVCPVCFVLNTILNPRLCLA